MLVRKVRGENRIGKITLTPTEVAVAKKLGISLEKYAQNSLYFIAKQRRWKWFFNKEKQMKEDDDDIQDYVNQREERNKVLEEVAKEIEKLPFGDTAASFAIFVRNMKR
jgi:hypothetical protein